jgi:alcohol dehydrogenase (cytochrome c)
VISIALDGRMFATNKATGEVVWERKIADPALGETLTIAPLIIRDLAIVGAAGGEFGIRGYIEATDLNTGKAAWRTYTIPGAGRVRQRDLEGRQGALEARRRLDLGDCDL